MSDHIQSPPPEEQSEPLLEQTEIPAPSPKKKTSFFKEAIEYLEIFVFAVAAVVLIFSFAFRICTVDGQSMENTLYEGENLLVSDLFYTPERGDIIVFHQTKTLNEPIVKRVIATEGEHVSIQYENGYMEITVTDVSGKETVLEEPYVRYTDSPLYSAPLSVTVPEGKLFVMGDNRNNSQDSRASSIGFVDERRVLGKVLFRFSPLNRFGAVQ